MQGLYGRNDARSFAIEAESIGWLPLGEGAYLHVGDPESEVITVVGVADAGMAGMRNIRGRTTFNRPIP